MSSCKSSNNSCVCLHKHFWKPTRDVEECSQWRCLQDSHVVATIHLLLIPLLLFAFTLYHWATVPPPPSRKTWHLEGGYFLIFEMFLLNLYSISFIVLHKIREKVVGLNPTCVHISMLLNQISTYQVNNENLRGISCNHSKYIQKWTIFFPQSFRIWIHFCFFQDQNWNGSNFQFLIALFFRLIKR